MAPPASYVTDLSDLLDGRGEPAGAFGRYVGLLVEHGSVTPVGQHGPVAMTCANPARRRRCGSGLWVRRSSIAEIEWHCPRCDEHGLVYGWRRSRFDLSHAPAPRGREGAAGGAVRVEELDAVRRLDEHGRRTRRILAEAIDVGDGYCVLPAGYAELCELHDVAAAAAERARGRERRLLDRFAARVDALRTTLPEFSELPEEAVDLEQARRAGTPADVIAIAREIAAERGRDDVLIEDLLTAQEAWQDGRRPLVH